MPCEGTEVVSESAFGPFASMFDQLLEDVRRAVREELAALKPKPEPEGWLSVAGAARHLDTTEVAIRSAVKRGELPVHRAPNGRLLFRAAELDEWVEGNARQHP